LGAAEVPSILNRPALAGYTEKEGFPQKSFCFRDPSARNAFWYDDLRGIRSAERLLE
jgi:hypothetical protein